MFPNNINGSSVGTKFVESDGKDRAALGVKGPRIMSRFLCALSLALISIGLSGSEAAGGCPTKDTNTDSKGHFISASMSWTADPNGPPNSVIFEIISTWRRNHTWPCSPKNPFTGPDMRPWLNDMVPIVGITTPDMTTQNLLQVKEGVLSSRLVTGDMKPMSSTPASYDLILKVTSLSVEEDWISGVSYVRHTYSAPYASKQPFYPSNYVASVGDSDTMQPYQTLPWRADFTSCCRLNPGASGATRTFSIFADVDLSDMKGSPRIVTLPQLWVKSSQVNLVYLCAVPAAGRSSLVRMSGGTLNDMAPKGATAMWEWGVIGGHVGASFAAQRPTELVSSQCGTLTLPTVYSAPAAGSFDYVTILSKLGSAVATADIQIRVLPTDAAAAAANVNVPSPIADAFGCTSTDDCQMRVSLGMSLETAIGSTEQRQFSGSLSYGYTASSPSSNGLEVRYVVGRSSMQSTIRATSPGRVRYSSTDGGRDTVPMTGNAQVSPQASLPGFASDCSFPIASCPSNDASASCKYVTDVGVSFSSSSANARPLQDVPYAADGRDYAATVAKGDAQVAAFVAQKYQLVANSNFNKATGGATVGVWVERNQGKRAMTELRVVNASQVASAMADGFTKLDKNLVEQSSMGELYIMFKRGSGPPILDVRTAPPTSCSECYECDRFQNASTQGILTFGGYELVRGVSNTAKGASTVDLWVKKSADRQVKRLVNWTPCTGEEDDWVICAQGAQSRTGILSSPQQCMLIKVLPKPAPTFSDQTSTVADTPNIDGVYTAYMGKKLRILLNVQQRAARVGEVVRVDFTPESVPQDKPNLGQLITQATPQGIFISSDPDATGPVVGGVASFSPTGAGDNPSLTQSRGYIHWTPSPYQGGWNGTVCVRACSTQSSCPAVRGQSGALCSAPKCFRVRVERCQWSVQNEDSFTSIAPRFQTNWLQLWYANPLIKHPDFPLQAMPGMGGGLINVGRVYRARWDDTVETITGRFGVTRERLLDLNWDLTKLRSNEMVPPEQSICVIADSCTIEASDMNM